MKSVLWKKRPRGSRYVRVFAAYMAIVFTIAMTAQGMAGQPAKADKGDKGPKAERIAEASASQDQPLETPAPAQPAPLAPPQASEPAPAQTPAPVPAPAAAPAPEALAAGDVVAAVETASNENSWICAGGVKLDESPRTGTYTWDTANTVETPTTPTDYSISITTYATPDGMKMDFVSNYPVAKVVVKGGPDGITYTYDPPVYSATGLHAPVTPGGSGWADVSHIVFCFGEIEEPEEGDLEVYKYLDANTNAEYDDEEMLEDWEFSLYAEDGTFIDSGSTDDAGLLVFTGLELGDYYVTETLTDGWDNTTDLTQYATVVDGETAALWFGNVPLDPEDGALKIYKYLDENENREYDEGEEMLDDWQFTVTQESDPIGPIGIEATAVSLVGIRLTDTNGEALFSDLLPGEYVVRETLTDGWHNTTPLTQYATVAAGQTAELWFGNHPDEEDPELGDLVIHKYLDENENSQYDQGEEMLADWEFSVVNPAGPVVPSGVSASVALIGTGTTNSLGLLSFGDLNPGTVRITETLQDGWKSTTGLTQEAEIVAGETTHVWFGNAEDSLRFTELDLAITKVADDHTVNEGQLVTYTLTYWNLMSEEDAYDYTIVDDYDERYLTIVNAGGGTVSGGRISWAFAGPLTSAMGKQTITYTARVIADMPEKTTNIDNVVVIDDDRDFNDTNDRDDERVVYTPVDDPYLPFTGGDYTLLLALAAAAAGVGAVLRFKPRTTR